MIDEDEESDEPAPKPVIESFFYPIIKPPYVLTSTLIDESLEKLETQNGSI